MRGPNKDPGFRNQRIRFLYSPSQPTAKQPKQSRLHADFGRCQRLRLLPALFTGCQPPAIGKWGDGVEQTDSTAFADTPGSYNSGGFIVLRAYKTAADSGGLGWWVSSETRTRPIVRVTSCCPMGTKPALQLANSNFQSLTDIGYITSNIIPSI